MKTYNLSDYELVKQYINGHQPSFEILIGRHKNRVFSYIMLIVKDRQLAEDIFQDTFIKVIKSLKSGRYQDEGRFVSWVMRIAHNLIIDHFRKEKHLPTLSNDASEFDMFNSAKFSDTTIEQNIIRDQITNDVKNLVDELPEEQRDVVIMRHYMGLSFKEISEQTGVSINTALGRMRYALINLRKLIKERNLILTD
jgi:RNA polymerase sigma-70 factor (ECF subfamily)